MLGTTLGSYRLERERAAGWAPLFVGSSAAIEVLLGACRHIEHPGIFYDDGKDASGCAFMSTRVAPALGNEALPG